MNTRDETCIKRVFLVLIFEDCYGIFNIFFLGI